MLKDLIKSRVYLDNSATTPINRKVARVIKGYLYKRYANPSSAHESGLIARASIELAREGIATDLNSRADQLIFTGSGTEGNNLALQGLLRGELHGKHIITSSIEHASITQTAEKLRNSGLSIDYVKVDSHGQYDLEALKGLIQPQTVGLYLSYVNSEIGTVQDVASLSEIARAHGLHLHLDAVQALPYLDIDLKALNADSVSFSGHKIGAPKGIGILYVRNPNAFVASLYGGSQEHALRAGTENVPYIMGLARAVSINKRDKKQRRQRVQVLRDYLIEGVRHHIRDVQITGHPISRSAHHASFVFKDVDGKQLVSLLSEAGYDTSSGTACSSKRRGPSKVIESLGLPDDYQMGSLRISLSSSNSKGQLKRFITVLKHSVNQLRDRQFDLVADVAMVSQDALLGLLSNHHPLHLLNVSPFAVQHHKLPGLLHMPIWKLKRQAKSLDVNRTVILICQHGDILAPKSAKVLTYLGFRDVRVLQGGFYALGNGA